MITLTQKYPALNPIAYQRRAFDPAYHWSRIEILGGRQLVAFDNDGVVMGTIDLALTASLAIERANPNVENDEDEDRCPYCDNPDCDYDDAGYTGE